MSEEIVANFTLNNTSLNAQYELSEGEQIDATFKIYANGVVWGDIQGDITEQTDLQNALNDKQDTLTAGEGISIVDNVISNTQTSAQWGNITGDISEQEDLTEVLNAKQDAQELANMINDRTSTMIDLTQEQ